MHLILSAIILLLAILDMVLGIGFFLNPVSAGADFGLDVASTHGSSTLRGDMTAFFVVAAVFMAWGAWKRRGAVLIPALMLFAIAFTGRLVNLLAVGTYDGWHLPMTVEALHIIVMLLAIRAWGGSAQRV
ncbi:hypothetical protein [Qipengyuania marisflavi]|uniref:DUF4345 domain-containing protein n=1 Tax=Qipengyuania marisflavi TaxID=2486356 RepID=A0A5S3NZM4_9SPHN|nr:hypothetical protein [Qipengyuania marisflavi]TMM45865.1 hypothetical protein FEV51_12305 [Qipengyuania marisflavi]